MATLIGLIAREMQRVDRVDGGEVREVLEEDGGAHGVGEVGARGAQHGVEVEEHALGLRLDGVSDELTGGRIERGN